MADSESNLEANAPDYLEANAPTNQSETGLSEAFIVTEPSDNPSDESTDSRNTCRGKGCTLQHDRSIISPLTQYCCLLPTIMADIALLYSGLHIVAECDRSVLGLSLNDMAMLSGSVGLGLLILSCGVLSGSKCMSLATQNNDGQSYTLREWLKYYAFLLALTSLPKLVFATVGLAMYTFTSAECQSSDLGMVLTAWSLFTMVTGAIDVFGIVSNWSQLRDTFVFRSARSESVQSVELSAMTVEAQEE